MPHGLTKRFEEDKREPDNRWDDARQPPIAQKREGVSRGVVPIDECPGGRSILGTCIGGRLKDLPRQERVSFLIPEKKREMRDERGACARRDEGKHRKR